jgi:hypothetical protein
MMDNPDEPMRFKHPLPMTSTGANIPTLTRVVEAGPILDYTMLSDQVDENLYVWYPWWDWHAHRIQYLLPGWAWRPRWRIRAGNRWFRVWWVWS